MKFSASVVLLFLAAVHATAGAADCSRADIDHYLDRGFTPQQVLELCRSEKPAPESDPERPIDAGYWRDVIDGHAIELGEDALRFSRELCVEYDRPNYAQRRKRACGKAHFSVGLDGLEVLESHKKLLYWGRNSIAVRSPRISRRYELNQQALSQRDQALLEQELERGEYSEIPIRDGVAVDVVSERLKRLAR